jgi:hypothetical protein
VVCQLGVVNQFLDWARGQQPFTVRNQHVAESLSWLHTWTVKKIGYESVDWVLFAQGGALVNTNEPSASVNGNYID